MCEYIFYTTVSL